MEKCSEGIDCIPLSLGVREHGAVVLVAYPACHAQLTGACHCRLAEANSLNFTTHDRANRSLRGMLERFIFSDTSHSVRGYAPRVRSPPFSTLAELGYFNCARG
jgi:hypothetical protein